MAWMVLASVGVIAFAGGCVPRLKPIFEEIDPSLVWPSPPQMPRVRYVGQLATEADLKAPRSLWKAIGELVVGAEPVGELYGPRSVVCTPDGERVWIADPGGRCLHVFDLVRRTYLKIDDVGGAKLLSPVGVCQGPPGSLYVCDSEAVAIHRVSDATGTTMESLRLPEEIIRPTAVSYAPVHDELFVVDVGGHDVKVLSRDGGLKRILGARGTGPGRFNYPTGVTGDGELLWIVDSGNHRVQAVTKEGKPGASFGHAGDAPGDLALPKGIALDSDGHLYIVDARFENVQVFDREGRLLLVFGDEGAGPAEFWLPSGIFIDHEDRIWICDGYNRRVQVFQYLKDTLGALAGDASVQADEEAPSAEQSPTRPVDEWDVPAGEVKP